MVRISISLPEAMYYEVKRIAKEEEKTFFAIIREAVDLIITKWKKK